MVYWGDVLAQMTMGNLCQPSTVMLTRSAVELAGSFDERMHPGEDDDYHLKVARVTHAALLNTVTCDYRVGSADQLTQPEHLVTIAENYVSILSRGVAEDRVRLELPAPMIARRLGEAHRWLGRELLERDRHAPARTALLGAMRHAPSMRTAAKLLLSCLPVNMKRALLHARRRTR